jgi:hypothetical protein
VWLDKHRDRSVAHAALVDLTLNLVCDFVGALPFVLTTRSAFCTRIRGERTQHAGVQQRFYLATAPKDSADTPQHSVAQLISRDEMT